MPKKCDRLDYEEWPTPEQTQAIRDQEEQACIRREISLLLGDLDRATPRLTDAEMRDLGGVAASIRCGMDATIWTHVKSGQKYTVENIVWSSDSHEWIVIYRGEDRRHPGYGRRLAEWHDRFRRLDGCITNFN